MFCNACLSTSSWSSLSSGFQTGIRRLPHGPSRSLRRSFARCRPHSLLLRTRIIAMSAKVEKKVVAPGPDRKQAPTRSVDAHDDTQRCDSMHGLWAWAACSGSYRLTRCHHMCARAPRCCIVLASRPPAVAPRARLHPLLPPPLHSAATCCDLAASPPTVGRFVLLPLPAPSSVCT
jgi:hypothetical protein